MKRLGLIAITLIMVASLLTACRTDVNDTRTTTSSTTTEGVPKSAPTTVQTATFSSRTAYVPTFPTEPYQITQDVSDIKSGSILDGKFVLGMSKSVFFKALREEGMDVITYPDQEYTDDGGFLLADGRVSYETKRFSFSFDSNNELDTIIIPYDSKYLSKAGLQYGIPFADAFEMYGNDYETFQRDGQDGYITFYVFKIGQYYLSFSSNLVPEQVATWYISRQNLWK